MRNPQGGSGLGQSPLLPWYGVTQALIWAVLKILGFLLLLNYGTEYLGVPKWDPYFGNYPYTYKSNLWYPLLAGGLTQAYR